MTKSVKIWTHKGKEIPNKGKEVLVREENWHPWYGVARLNWSKKEFYMIFQKTQGMREMKHQHPKSTPITR